MSRKTNIAWQCGYPPLAITDWCEREIDLALGAIRKDHLFGLQRKRKNRTEWEVVHIVMEDIETKADLKKLIRQEMDDWAPYPFGRPPGALVGPEDFEEIDALVVYLQELASFAAKHAKRIKRKVGAK